MLNGKATIVLSTVGLIKEDIDNLKSEYFPEPIFFRTKSES